MSRSLVQHRDGVQYHEDAKQEQVQRGEEAGTLPCDGQPDNLSNCRDSGEGAIGHCASIAGRGEGL